MVQRGEQRGVAMVEATLGTVVLLLVATATVQLLLILHAQMAVRTATLRAARVLAVTGNYLEAITTFRNGSDTAFRNVAWDAPTCQIRAGGTLAECTGTVGVPAIVPGVTFFMSCANHAGQICLSATGDYPIGRSGS